MILIRYDELASMIATRLPACGATTVVAVDGPSGAGKSMLASDLARVIGASVLHLEDLYPGWHGLEATPPTVARDVLSPIAADRTGSVRRWDWHAGRPGEPMTCPPVPVLIVDGVGSGARVLRPFISFLLWVDAPLAVRRERALARDGATYEAWWDVWAEQERSHFLREGTRAAADAVLTTG